MSWAIYAITVKNEIVYVGKSQCVENRIASHIFEIRNGKGLAQRFPEVFARKRVRFSILEVIREGPPSDDIENCWKEEIDLEVRLAQAERRLILKHKPRCNLMLKSTAIGKMTMAELAEISVISPPAEWQRTVQGRTHANRNADGDGDPCEAIESESGQVSEEVCRADVE